MAQYMQISMSCYGGPFKSETLNEIGTIERKWPNLAKATDFNRDFAETSARFSKIIGRIFVVPRLILNFIIKLTEKNENKRSSYAYAYVYAFVACWHPHKHKHKR